MVSTYLWAIIFWSKQTKRDALKLGSCQSLGFILREKIYMQMKLKFDLENGITIGFGLDFYLQVLEVLAPNIKLNSFMTHASLITHCTKNLMFFSCTDR